MYQILLACFMLGAAAAQGINPEIVLRGSYKSLPFPHQVTHSGIYCIESFVPHQSGMQISGYQSDAVYLVLAEAVRQLSGNERSSALSDESAGTETGSSASFRLDYRGRQDVLRGEGGKFIGANGNAVEIALNGSFGFTLHSSFNGKSINLQPHTKENLAAVDLIGIDRNGNFYIIAEYYRSQLPLQIDRELMVLSADNSVLATVSIPMIKGITLSNEFSITENGDFYHLITEKEGYILLRWKQLANGNGAHFTYPKEYQYYLHYNDELPVHEEISPVTGQTEATASRQTALRLGESYVLHKYYCNTANLAPTAVRASDGDTVKTPARLAVGMNAKVAYKWGGFNTLAQYNSGLQAGKFAGDTHTSGVSSTAVGVDCSGFVSRCWQLSSHYATSSMPSITTQHAAWDSLKPGDAIHKVGHVRMFIEKNKNGSLKVVESSARDWGVSNWSYLPSDLASYTPRYYNNMEKEYSMKRPVLRAAKIMSTLEVQLTFTCDTAGVKGYRVYRTTDGINWVLYLNENTVTGSPVVIPQTQARGHFRIASVLRNATLTESNWSNVLSVSNKIDEHTVLLIDAFDREIGDWHGAGHTFISRYARALENVGICYESIKHQELPGVNLNLYKAVIWMSGDQSTADTTITPAEQLRLAKYLESGGALFISGSELGWDLDFLGTALDKDFYYRYLRAKYQQDDAGTERFSGSATGFLNSISGNFAQVYEVSFPDAILVNNGSEPLVQYSNGKVGGVTYKGAFSDTSTVQGRLVYIGFPVETIANDTIFNKLVQSSMNFFAVPVSVVKDQIGLPVGTTLGQNYPNPFNPSTTIGFSLSERGRVILTVYDVLGREVKTLLNEILDPGAKTVVFNPDPGMSSGIYYYSLQVNGNKYSKKMIFLK